MTAGVKQLTIVAYVSKGVLYQQDGTMSYEKTRTKPVHIDCYISHGQLILSNKPVENYSLRGDILEIKEIYPCGDEFVTEYHLHSSDRKAFQLFMAEEKKSG